MHIAQSLRDLSEPSPLAPKPEAGMLATCQVLSGDRCARSSACLAYLQN